MHITHVLFFHFTHLPGGNTNGGVKGALSGTQLLKDNYLSGAMLVAHLADPGKRINVAHFCCSCTLKFHLKVDTTHILCSHSTPFPHLPAFDGAVTYSSDDNGDQIGGEGSVGVFASGLRNSYDFVLHSNGKIYATVSVARGIVSLALVHFQKQDAISLFCGFLLQDNGSNLSYGGKFGVHRWGYLLVSLSLFPLFLLLNDDMYLTGVILHARYNRHEYVVFVLYTRH